MVEDEGKKVITRFEAAAEAKLLKALDKIFVQDSTTSEEDAVCSDVFTVVDPANVCMCIGKSERGKRVLSRFHNGHDVKVPEAVWLGSGSSGDSLYSMEYAVRIFNVLNVAGGVVRFRIGKDTPGIFSSDDFEFWLAPRIEEAS